ncbi:MAG: glycosyltransferase, partial [Bacteroidales bacterium]|nr:glycosyltransferase [Bacteroidales bacterium]
MQKTKVVHITVVHRRYDSRIFYKECLSLCKAGYDVSLIVADGLGDEEKEGVKIIDIGKAEASRIKRMILTTRKAVKVALELNADIYHFHDPDLLSASLKLLKKGKVIFDSHEDFPALMLQRDYIPTFARRILFITARNIERYSSKRLSGIVCATETIRDKFLKYRIKSSEVVKNYPVLALTENESQYSDKEEKIACYVGGLTEVRGVREMVLS